MFAYMNMFPMSLKIGMARFCLKKLALFEHNKMDALPRVIPHNWWAVYIIKGNIK